NGVVVGVRSDDQTARCKSVICDPSYASNKVKIVGQVIRAICLLRHPVNVGSSTAPGSIQIIIPQKQVQRHNDIYVCCMGQTNMVTPKDCFFITSSYDATTHFESTCLDILDVYRRYMGEPFDFSKVTRGLDVDDNQDGAH
ncbi:unnamed protein product, partial [Rotaria sp. Silwood1]